MLPHRAGRAWSWPAALALLLVVAIAASAWHGSGPGSTGSLGTGASVQFGTIGALTPHENGYTLRVHLALRLSGETGLRACIADQRCIRSEGILDDYYVRDLHYALTYRLPSTTTITMVTIGRDANGVLSRIGTREIRSDDLYALAHGQDHPEWHLLYDNPGVAGFYIEVVPGRDGALDSIVRMEQVFHP